MNEKLYGYTQFVANVKQLIEVARKKQIEVIYVRHDDGIESELTKGKEGFEVAEVFKPKAGERLFDKKVNSAFKETGLLAYLRDKDEKEIIVVGLQTDYCIDATIKAGFEYGFQMIVPAYTNTTVENPFMSAEQSYHYHNEWLWPRRYATCISLEETLGKMQGYEN